MPQLSIITINLNNAIGLQKTIASVVKQTSQDFEYIVIDAGSTDGSVDVIKRYAAKITYWISEPDNGIYNAMNKGIKLAKGTYCQFLNSGDYLLTDDVTERMLQDIPECSFLYGNRVRELKGKRQVEKSFAGRQITLLDMYRSTFLHPTAYIKRTLFDQYGAYDESLKIVSDWKFFLITIGLHNEKVVYRDIDMIWFDSTGISSTNLELDKKERREVLKQVLPYSIWLDYEQNSTNILITKRLRKNKIAWFFVLNFYRFFFILDKIRNVGN